jgi:hypothetical protein
MIGEISSFTLALSVVILKTSVQPKMRFKVTTTFDSLKLKIHITSSSDVPLSKIVKAALPSQA